VVDSALEGTFRRLVRAGRSALIPYVCAGHPDRDGSLELLLAAADAGADILELGIPFSDPLADGPTIQKASFRALEGGMTVRGALELLREFRRQRDTPVVLFSYLNPIHRFGPAAFVEAAREAGAQGLLITDLPVGADPELEVLVRAGGLDLIRLLAPTTSPDRAEEVARGGSGFLYYISRTGVTGAREALRDELAREVESLRERVTLPVAVGFGISTPEQAAEVGGVADGVVVGSALVAAVEKGGVEAGAAFLRSLREAMDQGT
jgi:tryptophan synthase alpha chain